MSGVFEGGRDLGGGTGSMAGGVVVDRYMGMDRVNMKAGRWWK